MGQRREIEPRVPCQHRVVDIVLVQVIITDLFQIRPRFIAIFGLFVLPKELSGIPIEKFREDQSIVLVAIWKVLSDCFVVRPPLVDICID